MIAFLSPYEKILSASNLIDNLYNERKEMKAKREEMNLEGRLNFRRVVCENIRVPNGEEMKGGKRCAEIKGGGRANKSCGEMKLL